MDLKHGPANQLLIAWTDPSYTGICHVNFPALGIDSTYKIAASFRPCRETYYLKQWHPIDSCISEHNVRIVISQAVQCPLPEPWGAKTPAPFKKHSERQQTEPALIVCLAWNQAMRTSNGHLVNTPRMKTTQSRKGAGWDHEPEGSIKTCLSIGFWTPDITNNNQHLLLNYCFVVTA